MTQPLTLANDSVLGTGPITQRALLMHGILGRGNNLRTLAQAWVGLSPTDEAVLIDLRGHGHSPKQSPNSTLEAAGADVAHLLSGERPVRTIIGHSFGGKVALAAARSAISTQPIERAFILDSNPGCPEPSSDPNNPENVIRLLRQLDDEYPSRQAFVAALQALGLSLPVAYWLTLSTKATPTGGTTFALDLEEITTLFESYRQTDYWAHLDDIAQATTLHFIVAEKSHIFSPHDRHRLNDLAQGNPRITVDYLNTNHWLHTENLPGLMALIGKYVPGEE